MESGERKALADAAHFRLLAATTYVKGHIKHAGCLAVAARLEEIAVECALKGLGLSDLYAPTPGDAVALRGGALAEAEAWDLLAFDEAKFEAAEQNAQRISMRDPTRAARIRDLVGRMRAKTMAHVEREVGL
jgi:hypothetical protein